MIIKYPTGFYINILPQEPSDTISVTFTISNQTPPRSNLTYPKIPTGLVEKKRELFSINRVARRSTYGQLLFTVSKAERTKEGNSSKQYELGQILEFNLFTGRDVTPMLVSSVTEIRHDTNQLDYVLMGITKEEQAAIDEVSLLTQNQLTDRLNELKNSRANAEQDINVNQKLINELTRTIDSLEITLDQNISTGTFATEYRVIEDLINKLKSNRDAAFLARDAAISQANQYADLALEYVDQLRKVGVLVK